MHPPSLLITQEIFFCLCLLEKGGHKSYYFSGVAKFLAGIPNREFSHFVSSSRAVEAQNY